MADLMSGDQPYDGLKRRLAATGRVDLAMNLVGTLLFCSSPVLDT